MKVVQILGWKANLATDEHRMTLIYTDQKSVDLPLLQEIWASGSHLLAIVAIILGFEESDQIPGEANRVVG